MQTVKEYVFIFDIGNVMLDFDLEDLQKAIATDANIGLTRVRTEWQHPDFVDVETGRIEPEQHFALLSSRLGLTWTFAQYVDYWAGLFKVNPAGRQLYLELHQKGYRVAMLSNLGAHHWTAIQRRFPDFFTVGEQCFFSFALGLHKPDPRIYRAVCRELKVKPDQCVFLDDREDNVLGARSIGMHAHPYSANDPRPAEQFIAAFL